MDRTLALSARSCILIKTPVTTWASRRRQDLLDLVDRLTPKIHESNGKLKQIVERRPVTRHLSTHPGVGPLTALAFELVIGTLERFAGEKQMPAA